MQKELAAYIKKDCLINGLSNTVFNAAIAWLLLREVISLQRWGEHSYGIDLLATAFILPFIVALIIVPIARKKMQAGKIPSYNASKTAANNGRLANAITNMPQQLFLQACIFGVIGFAVFGTATLGAFIALDIEQIAPLHYSVFKGLWAGIIAGVLTGPMILTGARAP